MYHGTVSYCPEDDKLRLYVGRVPRDEYERLRAAGFVSTPKQDCDFVAVWTPDREDLAREYLDDDEDIGDEDYSPEERAADKSERFEGYRDKRATEAGASADAFDAGPSAFGHQNRRRAERQALRHDRKRVYAVSQWSKAEYWHMRTASVINHALHKSSAHVRRGRILTLEAEQRKHLSCIAANVQQYTRWQKVATLPGADQPVVRAEEGFYGIDKDKTQPAPRLAYALANQCHGGDYKHPRLDKTDSLYKLMVDETDPITATEAATLWLADARDPNDPDSWSQRWARHYELRLEYEKAMLANEGGMAGEAEMEVGGWIRGSSRRPNGTDWRQIHKINKSPATKRVTSVEVMGTFTSYRNGTSQEVVGLVLVKMDRLGEDAYRPPTDEERAAFAEAKAAQKAKTPTVPTINPTKEDAQRLQNIWNSAALATGKTQRVVEVKETTQAEFSERLKHEYVQITEHNIGGQRFKLRTARGGGFYDYNAARQVIVLTDKPQKPLPIDWDLAEGKPIVKTQAALFDVEAEPVAELASV